VKTEGSFLSGYGELRVADSHFKSFGCWVHGEWKQGSSKYALVDPSTGEVFAEATAADASLVNSALESARDSLSDWSRTPAGERAKVLHSFADLIRKEEETLASTVSTEVGKPLQASRDEVLSVASLIDYFAEEGLRLAGNIPLMSYRREQVLIVREPIGVVAAIMPFNYPLSTLACKMGAALAAGCTLVAKPDEHTPVSTLVLAGLAMKAGLRPGVFNVVTGPGPGAGRFLLDNPIPRLVTFTGGRQGNPDLERQVGQEGHPGIGRSLSGHNMPGRSVAGYSSAACSAKL
jgi:succinate-semialdehyde dehydrogenase/glutarate-semialdehyde dehydrogenase